MPYKKIMSFCLASVSDECLLGHADLHASLPNLVNTAHDFIALCGFRSSCTAGVLRKHRFANPREVREISKGYKLFAFLENSRHILHKSKGSLYILACSCFVLISESLKGSQEITFRLLGRSSLSKESKWELLITIDAVPSSAVALYMCFVFFHLFENCRKGNAFFLNSKIFLRKSDFFLSFCSNFARNIVFIRIYSLRCLRD